MNKIVYRLMILIGSLALTAPLSGCDVHEWPDGCDNTPAAVRCYLHLRYHAGEWPLYTRVEYDAERPGGVKSRAASSYDFRYLITVYDDSDPQSRAVYTVIRENLVVSKPVDGSSLDRTIPIDLPPGRYRIMVWSDYVENGSLDDKFYTTADLSKIAILQPSGSHPGNIEEREAFRGEAGLILTAADTDRSVTAEMYRPMARYSFIATDVDEFLKRGTQTETDGDSRSVSLDDYKFVVRYPAYMPYAFNIFTDKPVDSRLNQSFSGIPRRISDTESELAFDHVFVNGTEASVQVALDVYSKATGARVSSTPSITLPLIRDRLTEIRGRFLTTTASGGMGIDPGFNGDYNIEIK